MTGDWKIIHRALASLYALGGDTKAQAGDALESLARLRRLSEETPHEPVGRTEYVVKIERERDALHKALRDVRSALGTETVEDATVDFLAKTAADVRVMLDHARFERDEARAELEIMRAKKCRLMEERGKAEAERDEALRDLQAILAVIHRDGGHYTGDHGISKSVADAHATWAAVVRERDTALAEIEAYQSASGLCVPAEENGGDPGGVKPRHVEAYIVRVERERDEARAEVETLRARIEKLNAPGDYAGALKEMMRRDAQKELYHRAWEQAILDGSTREEAHAAAQKACMESGWSKEKP